MKQFITISVDDLMDEILSHSEGSDRDGDYDGSCDCGWIEKDFRYFCRSEWKQHLVDSIVARSKISNNEHFGGESA